MAGVTTEWAPIDRGARVAIVACMDGRFDPAEAVGLVGQPVWVIRNAGGVITDDVIRSLVVSQRMRGTTEIVLVHHTDCGMLEFRGADLAATLEDEVGQQPPFAFQTFDDLDASVRESMARIRANPFVQSNGSIRGFVYEIETGATREVTEVPATDQTLS
jgi:carbonic anhydrase